MSTWITARPLSDEEVSLKDRVLGRLAALLILSCTAAGLAWAGRAGFEAVTDAWVAPLHLSPHSEAVMQVRHRLTRETGELARLEAELLRFDGELVALERGLERLGKLKSSSGDAMKWQAAVHEEEVGSVDAVLRSLKQQRSDLQALHDNQKKMTQDAAEDLNSGVIDKLEYTKHTQSLRSIAAALSENQRLIEESEQRRRVAAVSSRGLRAKLTGGDVKVARGAAPLPEGEMPQAVQLQEHEVRLALELEKLESEQRSIKNLRGVAQEALDKQRAVLDDLKARPLFRATQDDIDLAFVPYSQLDIVKPGGEVIACDFGVFRCHSVGRVKEVLAGEVVAEGMGRELNRGLYAVLELHSPEAIKEKLLRVRNR
jgi:hypothetical protein